MPAPTTPLTVQQVYDTMCQDLALHWYGGPRGTSRVLSRDSDPENRPNLIGPLNFNSPNRVQLLGRAEIALLDDDRPGADVSRLEATLTNQCDLVIVTDGQRPTDHLARLSEQLELPLLITETSYIDCLNTLRYRLTQELADREVIHGVLMDVLGTGVLITGESGVGKSELALELISRGHILVADDAPEFRRIAPETLEGRCPPLLQDFLEVRGLGILNIARMYGHAHTRRRKILKFIIHLSAMEAEELNQSIDRSVDLQSERIILGITIPERLLPVAPGRNLAVLVEAAVRSHILSNTGYNATDDLVSKHAAQLEQH